MNRFFLDNECISKDWVRFPEDLAHQIVHVLRMGDGDSVQVLDNRVQIYLVRLQVDKQSNDVSGKIVGIEAAGGEPQVEITLYFGLSNRDKVEWILQKGTEVGVKTFAPFVSRRTLVQTTVLSEKRKNRWENIIREAAEQSYRGRIPTLYDPVDLQLALNHNKESFDLCLMAWEGSSCSEGLNEALAGSGTRRIALFVGPEGGFSEEEVQAARKAGCQVVSLGARILRMETAAILFPALVLSALDAL